MLSNSKSVLKLLTAQNPLQRCFLSLSSTDQARYKAVVLDMGGVLVPSPLVLFGSKVSYINVYLIQLFSEKEQELGLEPGSISRTIVSKELFPEFEALERGETNLEDFNAVFTYFYNKQVWSIYQVSASINILSFVSA